MAGPGLDVSASKGTSGHAEWGRQRQSRKTELGGMTVPLLCSLRLALLGADTPVPFPGRGRTVWPLQALF